MFEAVETHPDFNAMEEETLRFWQERQTFAQLQEKNRGRPRFSFLDGPITANKPMGIHHAWGRALKDLFQRYQAMLGYDQRWQNGFDCQGQWVEVTVEKELGFRSKQDIEAYGVDRFIERCVGTVYEYADMITRQSQRLGYWMDWGRDYYTLSDQNNYGIWAFLQHCHQRGWIYKGADVMPWCPRCGTGLSQQEIVTEGYRELTHPGLTVRFPLRERPGESLLVWTTTPWTLPANVAAAVGPELAYLRLRQGEEVLYLAEAALAAAGRPPLLRGEYEVLGRLRGADMAGWAYQGPYDHLPSQNQPGGDAPIARLTEAAQGTAAQAHRLLAWDQVAAEEGSGIVHLAPGCGQEDFCLGQELTLPVLAPLDEFGVFRAGYGPFSGRPAAEVTAAVLADLEQRGLIYRVEPYTHRYPVCWRCSSELLFRLVEEWFIAMDELRGPMMESTRQARWIPAFGLERELDWLRNMRDWMISKKRYWGLALPIWECPDCGHFEVLGGPEELRQRAVRGWEEFAGHSPHRPWVDAVQIACSQCGAPASRIPDVGTPWLDAGIVPFSTLDYWEDREKWSQWFPADFITECFPGQFRNWFYAMLAMSTVLEQRAPFRVCLGHALVKDARGEEMHGSKGNAITFDQAVERMGADTIRWLFLAQNPAVDVHFGYELGQEAQRTFRTLWNVLSFFLTYARVDGWVPGRDRPAEPTALDRWALSRLHQTTAAVREALDDWDTPRACRALEALVEDLSNWYVRRSRRRFWKSEQDADKEAAYHTLYTCLVELSKLLAPFVPFLAEALYQRLVRAVDPQAPESVHLCDYPQAVAVDDPLLAEMERVQQVVGLGRAARREAGLKVRQPLAAAWVRSADPTVGRALERHREHVLEELNLKALRTAPTTDAAPPAGWAPAEDRGLLLALDVELSQELRREGLARELVRHLQQVRKRAGLEVSNRVVAYVAAAADGLLADTLDEHGAAIAEEVLAVRLERGEPPAGAHHRQVELAGEPVILGVERAPGQAR
ncbi:MAG: isoleucine--tRNA ligase [Chloroflexia bacterium]|nr:isoleucine--tRNA ligase [Chloroflexia bacterium]